MSDSPVQRARFREGQVLRSADLKADQRHFLEMRRRHNVAHHVWGVVHGLELEYLDGELVLHPGLAVDGFGRELIVPEPVGVGQTVLDGVGGDGVDVWLAYARVPVTPPQPGTAPCGPGCHSRWREEAWVQLTPGGADPPDDPRWPAGVAPADLEYGPHLPPPDDPGRAWPVYVGHLVRRDEGSYLAATAGRPVVGLVGEHVVAASRRARVQVGNERSTDSRRLAVGLPDSAGPDGFRDHLIVDRGGSLSAMGGATLGPGKTPGGGTADSDLIVDALPAAPPPRRIRPARRRPPDEDPPAVELRTMAAAPAEAAPWQVYHAIKKEEGLPDVDQLRFEIGQPGDDGDPARSQLVICTDRPCVKKYDENGVDLCEQPAPVTEPGAPQAGEGDETGERDPCAEPGRPEPSPLPEVVTAPPSAEEPDRCCGCESHELLSVAADCTVTVRGKLVVAGQVVEAPIGVDPDNPRFASELLLRWLDGLTTASDYLGAFYGTLATTISAPPAIEAGATLNYSVIVDNLSTDVVTSVQVRGTISVVDDGTATPPQSISLELGTLPPGAVETELSFGVPNVVSGEVIIAVTALGLGPAMNPVFAPGSATVAIIPPIN